MFKGLAFAVLFGLFAAGSVDAATIYVPDHYGTIQDAINASSNGDTVIVRPGTYSENIDFVGKAIHLISESGPDVTAIDGNQAGSVVTFQSAEDCNTVLEGFTLTNGTGTHNGWSFDGGGVYCLGSSPTIEKNLIKLNSAAYRGGGGYFENSSAFVENNAVSQNSSGYGGGLYFSASSPTITSNTVIDNSAQDGGGLECVNGSDLLSTNNLIVDNSAWYGSGIYCCSSSMTIINNTLTGNLATYRGGGVYINATISDVEFVNTILWNDAAPEGPEIYNFGSGSLSVQYCDIQGGWPGSGNMDADPLFADAANGDFHLIEGSPCYNAGSNSAPSLPDCDFEGDPRILHGLSDIGADEFLLECLWTDITTLSKSTGGQVQISIEPGIAYERRIYFLLGGMSGTTPGITLPGGNSLPLNRDPFFDYILANYNYPALTEFRGILDINGEATAVLNVSAPVPLQVGTILCFAFTTEYPYDFQSNPVEVEIVP